jgi:hypothetical protein
MMFIVRQSPFACCHLRDDVDDHVGDNNGGDSNGGDSNGAGNNGADDNGVYGGDGRVGKEGRKEMPTK